MSPGRRVRVPDNMVAIDDIVAIGDIAKMAGISAPAASNWRVRYDDFPKPFKSVANGKTPLFRKSEFVAWYRDRYLGNIDPELLEAVRGEDRAG